MSLFIIKQVYGLPVEHPVAVNVKRTLKH